MEGEMSGASELINDARAKVRALVEQQTRLTGSKMAGYHAVASMIGRTRSRIEQRQTAAHQSSAFRFTKSSQASPTRSFQTSHNRDFLACLPRSAR